MQKLNFLKLDPRSLALFRILLGVALLCDTLHKLAWAREFYSDWGIMPRSYWLDTFMNPYKFSFHLAMGTTWFQVALILLQAICFGFFTLGIRTNLFGILGLILLNSLQARNNEILSCADELLRLALFWSLFLPLTSFFSFEKTKANTTSPLHLFSDFSAIFFRLQLVFVYAFTALYKLDPVWTHDFSAIYYALHIDIFAKPLAYPLREHYLLTQCLTAFTFALESIGVLASFLPGFWRIAVVFVFISLHLGTFFTMELGIFPWICIVYWIAFLPAHFWRLRIGLKLEEVLTRFFQKIHLKSNAQKVENVKSSTAKEKALKIFIPSFGFLCFNLVFWENLAPFSPATLQQPAAIKGLTDFLGLHQKWIMFAPYPMKNDGWFVVEGTFLDESKLDLISLKQKTYEKPEYPADQFPNSEWRKYMLKVWDNGSRSYLLPYGRFLCRKFSNANGWPKDLSKITVEFMKETTPPPGENFSAPVPVILWNHDCFLKD